VPVSGCESVPSLFVRVLVRVHARVCKICIGARHKKQGRIKGHAWPRDGKGSAQEFP